MSRGEVAGRNPWNATTMEWNTESPPPHGNFLEAPKSYRGPYIYSPPGDGPDFVPVWSPVGEVQDIEITDLDSKQAGK